MNTLKEVFRKETGTVDKRCDYVMSDAAFRKKTPAGTNDDIWDVGGHIQKGNMYCGSTPAHVESRMLLL